MERNQLSRGGGGGKKVDQLWPFLCVHKEIAGSGSGLISNRT